MPIVSDNVHARDRKQILIVEDEAINRELLTLAGLEPESGTVALKATANLLHLAAECCCWCRSAQAMP